MKTGLAMRLASIFRRVLGETPAYRAVSSMDRSPRAQRRRAPRRRPRSTRRGGRRPDFGADSYRYGYAGRGFGEVGKGAA
jgi:hypothetical protein